MRRREEGTESTKAIAQARSAQAGRSASSGKGRQPCTSPADRQCLRRARQPVSSPVRFVCVCVCVGERERERARARAREGERERERERENAHTHTPQATMEVGMPAQERDAQSISHNIQRHLAYHNLFSPSILKSQKFSDVRNSEKLLQRQHGWSHDRQSCSEIERLRG